MDIFDCLDAMDICPECGAADGQHIRQGFSEDYFYGYCEECGHETHYKKTPEQVVQEWNSGKHDKTTDFFQ